MTLTTRSRRTRTRVLAAIGAMALGASLFGATSAMADEDERATLSPGRYDAGQAASNIELLETLQQTGTFDGSFNSDLAFTGDHAIVGSYNGFQIYNIADPAAPTLRGTFVCPGGQGDVSVYGDILFMSVEGAPGRLDCAAAPSPLASDPQNFRGVRVFDISNLDNPVQVTAVQTCRGSHTHTVVEDADDPDNVYVYVSGTAGVRTTTQNVPGGCTNVNGNTVESQLDAQGNPILGPASSSRSSRSRSRTRQPPRSSTRPACSRMPPPAAPQDCGRVVTTARAPSRRRRPTRATTSRPTPSWGSPPVRVRATAC